MNNETLKELLEVETNKLEITVRAANCLRYACIKTIFHLVTIPKKNLKNLSGFGKTSLLEIENGLKQLHPELHLEMNIPKEVLMVLKQKYPTFINFENEPKKINPECLNFPIDKFSYELGKTYKILKDAGIKNIYQLSQLTVKQLEMLPGYTDNTYFKVDSVLRKHNLTLGIKIVVIEKQHDTLEKLIQKDLDDHLKSKMEKESIVKLLEKIQSQLDTIKTLVEKTII